MNKKILAVLAVAFVSVSLFAAPLSYDRFVERAGEDISNAAGKVSVSVLPFDADNQRLGDAISDDIEAFLGKDGVKLVDRKTLDQTMQELEFQTSGMVDDNLAVSIGHMAGANMLVMGEAKNMVDHYEVKLRLVDVESGTVAYQNTFSIKYDRTLENIMSDKGNVRGRQDFGIGLRAGAFISLSKSHEDMTEPGYRLNDNMAIGYPVALSVNWSPMNHFSLQVELDAMLNNGLKVAGTKVENNGDIHLLDLDYSYNSLDIPLMLEYDVIYSPVKVGIYGGAYLSMPISSMSVAGSVENGLIPVNESVDTDGLNYGVLGGASVEIPLGPGGLAIDARYIHDLNPLKVKMIDNVTGLMTEYGGLYRRGISVSAGYTFHL